MLDGMEAGLGLDGGFSMLDAVGRGPAGNEESWPPATKGKRFAMETEAREDGMMAGDAVRNGMGRWGGKILTSRKVGEVEGGRKAEGNHGLAKSISVLACPESCAPSRIPLRSQCAPSSRWRLRSPVHLPPRLSQLHVVSPTAQPSPPCPESMSCHQWPESLGNILILSIYMCLDM